MPVLTATGAGVRHRRRWTFRDLDVSIEPGEVVAVAGPPGSGRTTVLLALARRLRLSAGTVRISYPVQTTPGFFQAIHPLLPMTYVVQALRHAIDGGPAGTVTTGVFALLGYGAGALALTVLVAYRSRRLSPSALHPELVI